MTDALSASAPSALAGMEKSLSGRRDNVETKASDSRDFAATFDKVRQQRQADRASSEAPAASSDAEAATSDPAAASLAGSAAAQADEGSEPEASVGDVQVTDPLAPDAAAAALAQELMPLAPPVTQAVAEPAPTDGDPANAVAAAVAPRAAAAPTAAALQALGAGNASPRPEVRAASGELGLAASPTAGTAAPAAGKGQETTAASPFDASRFKAGADKPAGEAAAFKLDSLAAGTSGTSGSGAAGDASTGTGDNPGSAPGAEQAIAAASGREREARAEVVRLDTRLPLHSPRFAEGFSQQVVVLTQHGIQQAQMTLNPPELGPVEVRITLNQDQASVQIAAASGAARDVIQDALPKLRELMDQSGVRLNDAGVFSQLPQREQSSAHAQRQTWLMDAPGGRRRQEAELAQPAVRARRVGLIDAYA